MSCGPGEVDEEKVGALNWDNKKKSPKKGNNRGSGGAKMGIKYFNCGKDGHGINDCWGLKNPYRECKFLGGGHRVNCLKYTAKIHTTASEQATAHTPAVVLKDPFTVVWVMNFKQMQANFWDMKNLQEKGEGKVQWIFRVLTRKQT